jgi:hypothetical protein
MKTLAWWIGVGGILVAAAGVFGRFFRLPTIAIAGYSFSASTFLLLANTLLLVAIFLAVCSRPRE